MDPRRNAYQNELDQVHLSGKKAAETLSRMLAENDAIREKEQKKATRKLSSVQRWLPVAGLAVAAGLILVFSGVFRQPQPNLSDGDRITMQPQPNLSDGDRITMQPMMSTGLGNDTVSLQLADAKALFPGWSLEAAKENRVLQDIASFGQELDAIIEKDDIRLDAVITKEKPRLADILQDQEAYGKEDVRFYRDPDTGVLYATFSRDDYYVTLFAENMEEKAFSEAVMDAAGE